MLQRVVRLVATVADPIVVVAAPGQDLPEVAGEVTILRDAVAGRGPLQGLAVGARWSARLEHSRLCDGDRRAVPRAALDYPACSR